MTHYYCVGHVWIQNAVFLIFWLQNSAWNSMWSSVAGTFWTFHSLFPLSKMSTVGHYVGKHLKLHKALTYLNGVVCHKRAPHVSLAKLFHQEEHSHTGALPPASLGPSPALHFPNEANTSASPPEPSCVGAARVSFDSGHRRRHCRSLYKFSKYKAVRPGWNVVFPIYCH